jgi:Tol biopolymer transport system component
MGEVYRARDTRLGRDVAVKVLPPSYAEDEERLQRFEQEACAAGALNHPNILSIYDVGTHDGTPYVVSELLEGDTLRQRLGGASLAARRVIDYALQIAHGLAAAHDKGIVHRDLKPENLFVTKDGRLKILDFGIAKLTGADDHKYSQSEILTRRVHTDPGQVIGTAGYMSPEQVRGLAADHRSDLFSLGAILYEMLSGKRAFHGESAVETMNAILKDDPPELSQTNQQIVPGLERVVDHCLEKNPEERFQSARDLAFALEALSGSTPISTQTVAIPMLGRRMKQRELAGWAIGAAGILVAIIALVIAFSSRTPTDMRVTRLSILPPEKATFHYIAVSPNGRRLAFTATDATGKTQLWVRSLDSLTAQALSGTEGAAWPFWSPDSRFIGFFAPGKLKKIDATGGPAQTLCNAASGPTQARGGTWNSEDVIVFSPDINGPLYRVPAAGGEPSPLTSLDQSRTETSHRWPYFLPDGRHFIYFALCARAENRGIYLGSLDSKEVQRLMSAQEAAIYSQPGHLLFALGTTLMAQRFDTKKLQLVGDPFPVAEHVAPWFAGYELYASVSDTGVLAYLSSAVGSTQFAWFDRARKQLGQIGQPGLYYRLSLSPDEKRVAFDSNDSEGNDNIWVMDLARETPSRFTFHSGFNRNAIWSPDGSRIVFASNREGALDLYMKPASGAGNEELLLKTDASKRPTDWSRDGQFILYENLGGKTGWDLWVLPLSGDRKPFPFVQTEAAELEGRFSPDGHWIAYVSNESSGTNQVYVQGFSASGGKWQISKDGGRRPRWSRDGKELFYISADGKLMSVPVKSDSSTFEPGAPKALFDMRDARLQYFDVAGDGQRFLINNLVEEAASSPANVVLNWTADLKK